MKYLSILGVILLLVGAVACSKGRAKPLVPLMTRLVPDALTPLATGRGFSAAVSTRATMLLAVSFVK